MASRALSHYRAAPSKQQLHHNNNVGTARRRCSQLSGTRRSAAGCGLLVLANKASTRTTRIVLRQPVRGLGVPGDLCDVKPGYFRNYLGPFGFAKLATPDVLAEVQAKIDAEAKAKEEVKQQAEQLATALSTIGKLVIKRKAGGDEEEGDDGTKKGKKIFGSVSTADIVALIKEQTQREVDKAGVELPDVKRLGEYEVRVALHPEVTAKFTLVVAAAPTK